MTTMIYLMKAILDKIRFLLSNNFFQVKSSKTFKELGWSLESPLVNWGDLLVREVASKFFNTEQIRKDFSGAIFGGSVLSTEWFSDTLRSCPSGNILLASCGSRDASRIIKKPSRLNVIGVRGKLTRETFREQFEAVGDPGMLSPILLKTLPVMRRGFTVLFIPHYSEKFDNLGPEYERIETLRPRGESSKVLLKKISKANFVIAGSLHAGICALALGTPFCFYSKSTSEDAFKYLDFASLFEITPKFCTSLIEGVDWYLGNFEGLIDLEVEHFLTYSNSLKDYWKFSELDLRTKIEHYLSVRNGIANQKRLVLHSQELLPEVYPSID
jgi:hypothetical protein